MAKHSKVLDDTVLWKTYQKEVLPESERCHWTRKIYEQAVTYLKDVRRTFENYTLHDEKHVLNVLDAMGGLLGNHVIDLTVGEIEMLILAACIHDLGMVYTDEEMQLYYEDELLSKVFLRQNAPELLGFLPKDWPEGIWKWYLRTIHHLRLSEVLQNKYWKNLIEQWPADVAPMRCLLAVCQAHGENPEWLRGNANLEYLPASDVDPLFCALVLRLADLLDFDDTRAPKVLYSYVECNEKSWNEWEKHHASAGFRYSDEPSTDDLPYKARCKNPGIEHTVREFLDWIDIELSNCAKLQRYCKDRWQRFPFPRAVLRNEIESDGYMSGDFCFTMNQEQILKLLIGKDLYDNPDVFVRELLQNAIDATLLRGKMDADFVPEKSHIDFWEWNDKEGNLWFRIDDYGIGMTLGMFQRYFLRVGNSYYTSKELEKDLCELGKSEFYQGISHFGIGFLSCFLCGDYAEVSTLYFAPEKNRREELATQPSEAVQYGLRLQITGLTGYYTLKNQAANHQEDKPFPHPDCQSEDEQKKLERRGYRIKSGTSIVIRLNPSKLGTLDLHKTVEKYLCGARMPVYYNNQRIGRTYEEVMQASHEVAGKHEYELTSGLKKKFDECFPEVCGQYPQIMTTIVPLDMEENHVLPGLSGVLVKYEVRFDKNVQWQVKDQCFELEAGVSYCDGTVRITLYCKNKSGISLSWKRLERVFGLEKTEKLKKELEKTESCPQTEAQLGESWRPFSEMYDLYSVWSAYLNYDHEESMTFGVTECLGLDINTLFASNQTGNIIFAYQGVVMGANIYGKNYNVRVGHEMKFLMMDKWKPTVEVGRSKILCLPLEIVVAIASITDKYQMLNEVQYFMEQLKWFKNISLKEWREGQTSSLNQWLEQYQRQYFVERKQSLQKKFSKDIHYDNIPFFLHNNLILDQYLAAYLQDNYFMTINYEEGQTIMFREKKKEKIEDIYDVFPPMMFCKAASNQSRKYVCHAKFYFRRGITVDHPFIIWLLENAVQLKQYFQRQFENIIICLCERDAISIIEECNSVGEQLLMLTEQHGVDVGSFPKLCMDDFWSEKNEEIPF